MDSVSIRQLTAVVARPDKVEAWSQAVERVLSAYDVENERDAERIATRLLLRFYARECAAERAG